eukprot:g45623.t1
MFFVVFCWLTLRQGHDSVETQRRTVSEDFETRASEGVEYSQSHVRAIGTMPSAPRRDFLSTDHKVAQIPQPYRYGFSPVV